MARVLERLMPYLLIAPALIFLAAFFLVRWPRRSSSPSAARRSLGFQNYARAASDLNFTPALRNTLILVLIACRCRWRWRSAWR